MSDPLRYVSRTVAEDLFEQVPNNLERYLSGDFSDLSAELGWALRTTGVTLDLSALNLLISDRSPEAEVANSIAVFDMLKGLTPAIARDERIWVRLCHVEGLEFARKRWIGTSNPIRDIRLHFFASSLAQCRDDNAFGRLWWNAYIARFVSPDDPEGALRQILKRANIRLQFVDRANTSFRKPLAQGLIRLLASEPWLNSHDRAFEDYIRVLDRNGGGRMFEAASDSEIDDFLRRNLPFAQRVFAGRQSQQN